MRQSQAERHLPPPPTNRLEFLSYCWFVARVVSIVNLVTPAHFYHPASQKAVPCKSLQVCSASTVQHRTPQLVRAAQGAARHTPLGVVQKSGKSVLCLWCGRCGGGARGVKGQTKRHQLRVDGVEDKPRARQNKDGP